MPRKCLLRFIVNCATIISQLSLKTSGNRDLQMLLVAQLVKILSALFGTWRFITVCTHDAGRNAYRIL